MQGPYMELVNKLVFKKLVKVKSLSDINKSFQPILNKRFEFENFYTNYYQILDDPSIDVVLILTSMNEHSYIAQQALLKDKHVLVEKPMATNMKELNELYKVAKKSKKILSVHSDAENLLSVLPGLITGSADWFDNLAIK